MFSASIFQSPRFTGITRLQFKPVTSKDETDLFDQLLLSHLENMGDKNVLVRQIFAQANKAGQAVDYFEEPIGDPINLQFNYFVIRNDLKNCWQPNMLADTYKLLLLKTLYEKIEPVLKIFQASGDTSFQRAQELINTKFFPAFNTALSTSQDLTAWRDLKEGLRHIADVPKVQDISPYTLEIKGLFQELLNQKESILRQQDANRPTEYVLTLQLKPSASLNPFKYDIQYKQPDLQLSGEAKNISID